MRNVLHITILACMALVAPSALQAQAVRGQVVEGGTLAPVVGAQVVLLDSGGAEVGTVLTNAEGRFTIRVPAPGRYTFRADMIGRKSGVSAVIEVGADGFVDYRMELDVEPVSLEAIQVDARQQCATRDGNVQVVWSEARKALEAEAFTRAQRRHRFDVERYERETNTETGAVVTESRSQTRNFAGNPFVSRPAAELAEHGYYVVRGTAQFLYAPSAEVLLSDEFLATHCFSLRRSNDRPGELGLAFEPVRDRRVTDIRGTLWLDQGTSELRTLEFNYTRLPDDIAEGGYGGSAKFLRLPTGSWIVEDWKIRMPVIATGSTRLGGALREERRVVAMNEQGGQVVAISEDGGQSRTAVVRAQLTGVVQHEADGTPLRNAEVVLVGTSFHTVTDSTGRFTLSNLPGGTYQVTFRHPDAQRLRLTPPVVDVQLAAGAPAQVRLALPAAPVVVADADDDAAASDDLVARAQAAGPVDPKLLGRVHGRVVDHNNGRPLQDVTVELPALNRRVGTNADGRFIFRDVPPGAHQLQANLIGYEPRTGAVTLSPAAVVDVNLALSVRPIELPAIVVTERSRWLELQGYYDRRMSGLSGYFFDRQHIERRKANGLTDLLSEVPTVKIVHRDGVRKTVRLGRGTPTRPAFGGAGTTDGCEPAIFLDGRPYKSSGNSEDLVDNVDFLTIEQMEAVEVYLGAATPIQYQSNNCGAILIWTRRGR